MPDLAVSSPLAESDLRDQFRTHPMCVFAQPAWWRRLKGRDGLLDRFEAFSQVTGACDREPRPDLAREHESVAVEVSGEQCTNALSRSLGIGKAANHEFLTQDALRLQPVAAAPGFVLRIGALRHDAFEMQPARFGEDGRAP